MKCKQIWAIFFSFVQNKLENDSWNDDIPHELSVYMTYITVANANAFTASLGRHEWKNAEFYLFKWQNFNEFYGLNWTKFEILANSPICWLVISNNKISHFEMELRVELKIEKVSFSALNKPFFFFKWFANEIFYLLFTHSFQSISSFHSNWIERS